MASKRKYERLIALRIDDEDHRRLEALADRERTSVSAVVRRFVAEGLDRESEPVSGRKRRRGKSHD
jgi:predicted HicB family RNase H-like nuclease